MNKEQLNDKLVELLGFVEQGMTKAYEVGKVEVPLVVQEYLTYNMYIAVLNLVVCLIILVMTEFFIKFLIKYCTKNDGDEVPVIIGISIAVLPCLLLITLYNACTNLDTIIKIKVAPRVYAIQAIKDIVK
jgi:hypothetical protein